MYLDHIHCLAEGTMAFAHLVCTSTLRAFRRSRTWPDPIPSLRLSYLPRTDSIPRPTPQLHHTQASCANIDTPATFSHTTAFRSLASSIRLTRPCSLICSKPPPNSLSQYVPSCANIGTPVILSHATTCRSATSWLRSYCRVTV